MDEIAYQLRYALPLWLIGLLTDWWPDNRITIRIRGGLYSLVFKRCGHGLTVARRVTFLNAYGIELGSRVYIACGCWIDGIGGVSIGDGVQISPYVVMASSTHCFKNGSVSGGGSRLARIAVGKGSWIGSHSVIAAGAEIGEGCLIAGNAAVVGQVPPHMIAGGVPAKIIGPVQEFPPDVFSRRDLCDT